MMGMLETLAWNSLIVVPMAAAIWLAGRTRLLRDRPAACHVLWLLVLLKLVTPPVIPVPVLSPQVQPESAAIARDALGDPHDLAAGRFQEASLPSAAQNLALQQTAGSQDRRAGARDAASETSIRGDWRPSLLHLLVGISLTVSAGLWCIAARHFFRLQRLIRSHECAPRPVMQVVGELLPLFRLRRQPAVIVVDESIAPMLWAAPRSVTIALPRELVESMPLDQLRAVIGHELAHYARRDHWTHLFCFVATSLVWWHPVAWFACREMIAAAEACCDAMALKRLAASRKAYARTLLSMVDFVSPNRSSLPGLALTFGESHTLKRRIAMIASRDLKPQISLAGWMLLAAVVVMVSLFPACSRHEAIGSETGPSAGVQPSGNENAAADPKEAPAGDPQKALDLLAKTIERSGEQLIRQGEFTYEVTSTADLPTASEIAALNRRMKEQLLAASEEATDPKMKTHLKSLAESDDDLGPSMIANADLQLQFYCAFDGPSIGGDYYVERRTWDGVSKSYDKTEYSLVRKHDAGKSDCVWLDSCHSGKVGPVEKIGPVQQTPHHLGRISGTIMSLGLERMLARLDQIELTEGLQFHGQPAIEIRCRVRGFHTPGSAEIKYLVVPAMDYIVPSVQEYDHENHISFECKSEDYFEIADSGVLFPRKCVATTVQQGKRRVETYTFEPGKVVINGDIPKSRFKVAVPAGADLLVVKSGQDLVAHRAVDVGIDDIQGLASNPAFHEFGVSSR